MGLIKKHKKNHSHAKHKKGLHEHEFKQELDEFEPDRPTTILNADSETTILKPENSPLQESTPPLASAEVKEEKKDPQSAQIDAPDTTVLNFADVRSIKVDEEITLATSESECEPEVKSDTVAKPEVKEPEPKIDEGTKAETSKQEAKEVGESKAKKSDKKPKQAKQEKQSKQKKKEEIRKKAPLKYSFVHKKTGDVFHVNKNKMTVGKSKFSDIQIKDTKTVSRTHALLHLEKGQLFVEDNNSLNGTFINNMQIEGGERHAIEDGDVLRLSDEELICQTEEGR